MKYEMLDIVKIHQNCSNTFEEYIPITALPKDAGGTYKDSITLKGNYTLNSLFFLYLNSFCLSAYVYTYTYVYNINSCIYIFCSFLLDMVLLEFSFWY